MKMGSKPEISDAHDEAAQLIPWLINGTLDAEEAASVRAHLAACPSCRADFDSEQRLYEAIRSDGPLVFSGEPSFQKLVARLEADDFAAAGAAPDAPETAVAEAAAAVEAAPAIPAERSAARNSGASRRTTSRRRSARRRFWGSPVAVRWIAAAALIEAVGLGLGAWAWPTHGPVVAAAYPLSASALGSNAAPYRTLTTPPPSYAAGSRVRVVFRPRLSLGELQRLLLGVGAHIVDG